MSRSFVGCLTLRFLEIWLVASLMASASFAEEVAKSEARERAVIEKANKSYDDEVATARAAYDEALTRAGRKLLTAYDVAISAGMKRGGGEALDLANRLNDEKKAKAALIENPIAVTEGIEAHSIGKMLAGTWTAVKMKDGRVEWVGKYTFDLDGGVVGDDGVRGTWKIEARNKRVLITWPRNDIWDAFKLPLSSTVTVCEAWSDPDLMVAYKTKRAAGSR